MRASQAITVWCDESRIQINGHTYHLIGALITNSDNEEYEFKKALLQCRKDRRCWNVIHGTEIREGDSSKINLIDSWINRFQLEDNVWFHVFVYKENRRYAGEGFERYFAKQSAFSLANKMKSVGYPIQTLLKDVGTVTYLFDRRRDEAGDTLGNVYEESIKTQLRTISKKGNSLTVRFSFISSNCFNCMQLTDVLLYMVKNRIEKELGNELPAAQNRLVELWESYFLDENILELKDFEFDSKFNYFRSNQ